jgi:hypothetical protein
MKKRHMEELEIEVKDIFNFVRQDWFDSIGFKSTDWDLELIPGEDPEELKQYAIYLNRQFPTEAIKKEFIDMFDRDLKFLMEESPSQVAH